MISPSRQTVWLASIPAVLSLSALLVEQIQGVVLLLDGLLVVLLIYDACTLPKSQDFTVAREAPTTVAKGWFYPVRLTIGHGLKRPLSCMVLDDLPEFGEAKGLPKSLQLPPKRQELFDYDLAVHQRGRHQLEFVSIMATSALGLWRRHMNLELHDQLAVYPDIAHTPHDVPLSRDGGAQGRLRRLQRVGGEHEFERLKEYHSDDEYRHIAWRASARQNRLISRAFQPNQHQTVLFMLDCGRMMRGQMDDRSYLDESLNGVLLLSNAALRQQDSVGVLTFSGQVDTFIPPRSGRAQLRRIMQGTFDRFPDTASPNYAAALTYANHRCRKRTLLIVITHMVDDHTHASLQRHLGRLKNRHLILLVLFRDHAVFDVATANPGPDHTLGFYQAAAAADYLLWRDQRIKELRRAGILCADIFAEDLTSELLRQYEHIKRHQLL